MRRGTQRGRRGVEDRLRALEDKKAIGDLFVRYGLRADLDRTAEFVELWTEDAVFDLGPHVGSLRVWELSRVDGEWRTHRARSRGVGADAAHEILLGRF